MSAPPTSQRGSTPTKPYKSNFSPLLKLSSISSPNHASFAEKKKTPRFLRCVLHTPNHAILLAQARQCSAAFSNNIKTMRLILARHGETVDNVAGI
jgi:hypothetical protein